MQGRGCRHYVLLRGICWLLGDSGVTVIPAPGAISGTMLGSTLIAKLPKAT
jgi:hypothetical protein